jgi:hypothetical protein
MSILGKKRDTGNGESFRFEWVGREVCFLGAHDPLMQEGRGEDGKMDVDGGLSDERPPLAFDGGEICI